MKKNMGNLDKVLRILGALLLVVLYFTKVLTGVWGIIALIVAVIFVITSIVGFCPLYVPFKINTAKKE